MGSMSWTQFLFGFKGRIQRMYWWITSLVVLVVSGMLSQSLEFWAQEMGSGAIDTGTGDFEPSGSFAIGMGLIAIFNMWINFAVGAKRLHDRNRSGWWLLWPTLAMILAIILLVIGLAEPEAERAKWFVFAGAAGVVAIALGIWLFIELGFLKGTHGPNRFGPDHLGAAAKRRQDLRTSRI
jgi:uncharacterized membrane protein YhaH (DUF805 family)